MNLFNEIHWHEGLFIQPHHFQILQRNIINGFVSERKADTPFPYGLLGAEIDLDRLENEEIIAFNELKVIMPSGLYVEIGKNAYIPPLSLKQYFASGKKQIVLKLALPLVSLDNANVISENELENEKVSRIFRLKSDRFNDENSGSNPKNILIRKLNARIFVDNEQISDYELIPILRINKSTGKLKEITVDKNFAPPCFNIKGTVALYDYLYNLTSNIVNHTKVYGDKLHSFSEFKSGSAKLQKGIFKLQILNSYAVELQQIMLLKTTTPFEIYLLLKKFIAELSTVIPVINPFDIKDYLHDSPMKTFISINNDIKKLFNEKLIQENFRSVAFEKGINGVYEIEFTDEIIDNAREHFICISTKMHADVLVRKIINGSCFKLLPLNKSKGMAIPGVSLIYQQNLPEEIFRKNAQYFFRVKDNNPLWEQILSDKKAVILEKIEDSENPVESIELITLLKEGDVK